MDWVPQPLLCHTVHSLPVPSIFRSLPQGPLMRTPSDCWTESWSDCHSATVLWVPQKYPIQSFKVVWPCFFLFPYSFNILCGMHHYASGFPWSHDLSTSSSVCFQYLQVVRVELKKRFPFPCFILGPRSSCYHLVFERVGSPFQSVRFRFVSRQLPPSEC